MRRSIAQKAQIMVITGTTAGIVEYGKLVLILNNVYGFYFKVKDLMLDADKLIKITDQSKPTKEALNPETLKKKSALAKITGKAKFKYSDTEIAKPETEDKKYAWVNASILKEFGTNRKYYVENEKSPVFITDAKNKPVGMLLPVKYSTDIVEEEEYCG